MKATTAITIDKATMSTERAILMTQYRRQRKMTFPLFLGCSAIALSPSIALYFTIVNQRAPLLIITIIG
jgi:hypothetical protein